MNSPLLTDLRFVIGLFFSILGVILIVLGMAAGAPDEMGLHLNLFAGGIMEVFGLFMLALALRPGQTD